MVGASRCRRARSDLTMVTPIARLTSEYLVVVVPAASPHKTMADLVAAFKADPGKCPGTAARPRVDDTSSRA